MKVLPFDTDGLNETIDVLKNGGIIAHPADTCFGLAGDLMNPEVVKKIQAIKQRDANEPMSIMISVPEQIRIHEYAQLNEFSEYVIKRLFPSPVTLVLPKGPKIPKWYFPEIQTIGIRVPMHDLTQDILMKFGGPLITTSANISSNPLCFSCDEVVDELKGQVERPQLCLEGSVASHNLASTVVLAEKDHLRVLRKGPVTASQLEGILGLSVEE